MNSLIWLRTCTYLSGRNFARSLRDLKTSAGAAVDTAGPRAGDLSELLHGVVKVFSTQSTPDYTMPWQNKPQEQTTGSGFIASTNDGLRILTNAHVVADGTFVEVRKYGSSERFEVTVECIAHECDLATLKVRDDAFWAQVKPLPLANELPNLQDNIAVVGYPTGGDNLSVTSGVISRIEMQQYSHSASRLLALQIDAAINSGNSGGPAVKNGLVYGIAFQNLTGADGIGFVIPSPVIKFFLRTLSTEGGNQRFCSLEVKCQGMENTQLRKFFGMRKDESGVLINKIAPLSDAARHLKVGDVITRIDGIKIANDGTIEDPTAGRINFQHLVSMKLPGETAVLRVIRDGRRIDVKTSVYPPAHLVPVHMFDRLPQYYLVGGLLFTTLTQPFLQEYGEDWINSAPRRLVNTALYDLPNVPGEEVIVLADVLPHRINAGYQKLVDLRLKRFGSVDVVNMNHLKKLIQECDYVFFRFDFDDDRTIVLNASETRRAGRSILRQYRIPEQKS